MAQNSPKKRYRVRYDRIIFVIIIFAVLILILTSCISSCGKHKEKTAVKPTDPLVDQLETLPGGQPVPAATEAKASPAGDYQTISKSSSDIHSGDLILANAEYPCDFDPDAVTSGTSADINFVTIKSILDTKSEKHYLASDWEVGLDRTAAYAMDSWFEAFYQATGNTDIRMIKGYTFDSGDYDFRTGRTLTMGIFPEGEGSNYYKPEGEYAWLDEHASEYGFILRYPEGKEGKFDDTITNRTSATYRYVGVAAATYIRENSLCLEEFLDSVKNYSIDSMLRVACGSAQYGMYYIPANTSGSETSFGVPSGDTVYTISGNNMDGFIITVALNSAAEQKPTSATPQYEDLDE
ncbi:MAG: hypothetical protein K5695_17635 [Oscillospiraceae bacterium]|nr:hypothetical protein [Oscillospiraceae bacterium]